MFQCLHLLIEHQKLTAMNEVILQVWLCVVAFARLASVYMGYVTPFILQDKVFNSKPELVNPLQGRTFGIWTSVTCGLCIIATCFIHEQSIIIANILSFVIAWIYFVVEMTVYQTMTFKGAGAPFIVSSM